VYSGWPTNLLSAPVYKKSLKLVDLLETLGCPHAKLYNAGNDVAFTLKAFLTLAIKKTQ
jgi:hypothetical protein